jgi:hypothetical protein
LGISIFNFQTTNFEFTNLRQKYGEVTRREEETRGAQRRVADKSGVMKSSTRTGLSKLGNNFEYKLELSASVVKKKRKIRRFGLVADLRI